MPELTESRHDVLPRSDCGEYTTLAEAKAAGAPTLNYGLFFNVLLDFLIVALAVFMLVRQVNRLKRVEKLPEATRKACRHLDFIASAVNLQDEIDGAPAIHIQFDSSFQTGFESRCLC